MIPVCYTNNFILLFNNCFTFKTGCMKLNSILLKSVILLLFSILFYSYPSNAQNASLSVTGKVADDNGKGIPGVTVTVKGTTTSTVTREDGSYKITVPPA